MSQNNEKNSKKKNDLGSVGVSGSPKAGGAASRNGAASRGGSGAGFRGSEGMARRGRVVRGIALCVVALLAVAMALVSLGGCSKEEMMLEHTLVVGYHEGDGVLVAAALLLDPDGKIVKAEIDEIDLEGEAPVSKKTLGDEYGMKDGGARMEWDDEVGYLETALSGKTLEEAMAMKSGAGELASRCTIKLDGFQAAITNAMSKKDDGKTFSTVDAVIGLSLHAERRADGYLVSISAIPCSMMGSLATETLILEVK